MGYKLLDLGYSYSWMGETKPKKINHWIIWGVTLLMGYKRWDFGYGPILRQTHIYNWTGETKLTKITKKKAFLYQSHQNIPNPSPNPSGNNYNFTWLKEA